MYTVKQLNKDITTTNVDRLYPNYIQPGDILVWSSIHVQTKSDLYGKIIQFFTMSEYDHAGIVVKDNIGCLQVYEAVPPKVRLTPLRNTLPFYHISTDLEWKDEYYDYCLTKIGEPYSVLEAIFSYFRQYKLDNRWTCIELILDFYNHIGLEVPDLYTPKDMVNYWVRDQHKTLNYITKKL